MGKSFLARVPVPVKLGVPVAAGLLAAACGSAAGSPAGSAASGGTSGGPAALIAPAIVVGASASAGLAVGQLAIAAALGGVTVAHLGMPASSFGASAPTGELATAAGQTSLLFICASLPLFLGGELAAPARTIRRGLTAAWLATAAVLVLAVAPLAADPALAQASIPGMTAAELFAGHGFAMAVGIGVAVSIAGVMLAEYLALSRLVTALTAWRLRPVLIAIGAVMVAAAPVTLISPERIYTDLIKPSLIALWLSQLIVFAVYPRFAARHGDRRLPAWGLTVIATGFALYGLWFTFQPTAT